MSDKDEEEIQLNDGFDWDRMKKIREKKDIGKKILERLEERQL